MRTVKFIKSYNWRMLLMRILVTMLSLLITAVAVPKIMFVSPSFVDWVWVAVVLGLITALVKPVIQFLTLRFIFATGGLVVVVINTILLYLLAWLLPNDFAVSGLFWTAVGGLVLGVSSTVLEYLLGLTPPIVSEKYPEIRQRVKDRQFYRMQNELSRIEVTKKGSKGQLAAAKVMVMESNPAMAKLLTKDANIAAQEPLASAMPGEQGTGEEMTDSGAPGEQVLALTDAGGQNQAASEPIIPAGVLELASAAAQPVGTVEAEVLEDKRSPFSVPEDGQEA
jgi:putative membrane protein